MSQLKESNSLDECKNAFQSHCLTREAKPTLSFLEDPEVLALEAEETPDEDFVAEEVVIEESLFEALEEAETAAEGDKVADLEAVPVLE